MSKVKNDPWAPQSAIPKISMPGDLDPRKLNVSSEEYIATLEAKLHKLQGKSGAGSIGKQQPKSRDILQGLGEARRGHMEGYLKDSNPYSTMGDVEGEGDAPQLSAIQKKLHPERQALTQEELKVLVDHDDLAKRVSELLDVDKQNTGDDFFNFNEYKTSEAGEKSPTSKAEDLERENSVDEVCAKSDSKSDNAPLQSEACENIPVASNDLVTESEKDFPTTNKESP